VLNNIRAKILDNPAKASESLKELADMLRYNLQRDKNTKVSLGEELTIVEEYLALCKIQFEDRLNFVCEVEPDAKTLLIPRMLLQLCVENAVKHGIGKLPLGGTITLRIAISDQLVAIDLSNPCPALAHSDGGDKKSDSGIGLSNINSRLKLMYPALPDIAAQFKRNPCPQNPNQDEAQIHLQLPLEYQEVPCE